MRMSPFPLTACRRLAKVADLQTPAIDVAVTLSKIMLPDPEEGRTVENIGFAGRPVQDIPAMCRKKAGRYQLSRF